MRPATLLGALALALLAAVPFAAPSVTGIVTLGLANGFAVLGILILLRAGQVSFGHGLYFAVGAYVVAFAMRAGVGDVALLLPLALLATLLLGLVVGLFVVRYREIFFAMLNLAFAMVLYAVLVKAYDIAGGSDGMRIARPHFFGLAMERAGFELGLYYLILALVAVLGLAVARYLESPAGRALEALKANETRLDYLGVSPQGVLLAAYVISAGLAGLAGAILGIVQGVVTPDFAYWVRSGEFVFIAVLGGGGHVAGAFLGALLYQFVRLYAAAYAAGIWQAILGVVLLGIILWAPAGLVGLGRLVRPARPAR
jgi:ABC-type branched-subunit amino acid transport system permease subunit